MESSRRGFICSPEALDMTADSTSARLYSEISPYAVRHAAIACELHSYGKVMAERFAHSEGASIEI